MARQRMPDTITHWGTVMKLNTKEIAEGVALC